MPSLFVAVPYTRPHTGRFVESLLFTKKPEQLAYKHQSGMAIDIARNYLVECWKQTKEDFLLFIDNDATFHPDAILRLMDRNLPVIGGCMYTRTVPPRPTMGRYAGKNKEGKRFYRFAEAARKVIHYCYDHGIQEVDDNACAFPMTPQDLFSVEGIGMHFTMIRRDVLEKVKPPYFVMQGTSGAGEDFYFCQKALDSGFQIYADLSIHTGHCVGEENDLGIKDLLYIARFTNVDEAFTDSFDGKLIVG
jgi:glycosyltransferase involved in cell wall biosynthesis